MGILKAVLLVTAPLAALTIAAFRLRGQLPIAARLFGNYIGLGYVYFKSIITYVKPVDHLPFEMISLARKTSQQSQALKRQLKSTLKRVKEDINAKKEQTFNQFATQAHLNHFKEDFMSQTPQQLDANSEPSSKQNRQSTGSQLILAMMKNREALLRVKTQKKRSRRFFEQV